MIHLYQEHFLPATLRYVGRCRPGARAVPNLQVTFIPLDDRPPAGTVVLTMKRRMSHALVMRSMRMPLPVTQVRPR